MNGTKRESLAARLIGPPLDLEDEASSPASPKKVDNSGRRRRLWEMARGRRQGGSTKEMDAPRDRLRHALNELSFQRPVRVDHPLAEHTTFRIGGPAWAYFEPVNANELQALLALSRDLAVPTLILGSGSNLLVRDGGFAGIALSLAGAFETVADVRIHNGAEGDGGGKLLVGAGVTVQRVIRRAIARGYVSLLRLVGIPGTIGGALAMNAGTGRSTDDGADGYIADLVQQVGVVDANGAYDLRAEECGFRYRGSGFPPLSVIADAFLDVGPLRLPPERCKAIVRERLARRKSTQPLTLPNAGSIFKNPPGEHAAALIQECGLKGHTIGGASISPLHANFIVNHSRTASANDVLSLIELAKERVKRQFGLELETEVKVVGVDP